MAEPQAAKCFNKVVILYVANGLPLAKKNIASLPRAALVTVTDRTACPRGRCFPPLLCVSASTSYVLSHLWFLNMLFVTTYSSAWCIYDLNYATACACLYDTSMLASMIYL
jgi:hypothetical protein